MEASPLDDARVDRHGRGEGVERRVQDGLPRATLLGRLRRWRLHLLLLHPLLFLILPLILLLIFIFFLMVLLLLLILLVFFFVFVLHLLQLTYGSGDTHERSAIHNDLMMKTMMKEERRGRGREGVLLGDLFGFGGGLDVLRLAEEEIVVADTVDAYLLHQEPDVLIRVLVRHPLMRMQRVQILQMIKMKKMRRKEEEDEAYHLGLGHLRVAELEEILELLAGEVPQAVLLRHRALHDRALEPAPPNVCLYNSYSKKARRRWERGQAYTWRR